MSVSKVSFVVCLAAAGFVFLGWLLPFSSFVAGIAALVCAIATAMEK